MYEKGKFPINSIKLQPFEYFKKKLKLKKLKIFKTNKYYHH